MSQREQQLHIHWITIPYRFLNKCFGFTNVSMHSMVSKLSLRKIPVAPELSKFIFSLLKLKNTADLDSFQ